MSDAWLRFVFASPCHRTLAGTSDGYKLGEPGNGGEDDPSMHGSV